ncbi:MAG: hypothetical protein QW156_04600 [Candidatus Aenigmatarchaeota archaeon]
MAQIMTIDGLEGRLRRCIRYKMTRRGKRCAKYTPLSGGLGEIALELEGPIRTCSLYGRGRKGLLRCAEMVKVAGIPVGPIEKMRKVPYHYVNPKYKWSKESKGNRMVRARAIRKLIGKVRKRK